MLGCDKCSELAYRRGKREIPHILLGFYSNVQNATVVLMIYGIKESAGLETCDFGVQKQCVCVCVKVLGVKSKGTSYRNHEREGGGKGRLFKLSGKEKEMPEGMGQQESDYISQAVRNPMQSSTFYSH